MKKYFHCAENQNLVLSDKIAKVQPIYGLMNTCITQIFFWDKDFSIDKQMISYFKMHSAKQTMRNKGYKNWIQKLCFDK